MDYYDTVTEDIFKERWEEIEQDMSKFLEMRDDDNSKSILSLEIELKLWGLFTYYYNNREYKKISDEIYHDSFEDMIHRAIRNFNPCFETFFRKHFRKRIKEMYSKVIVKWNKTNDGEKNDHQWETIEKYMSSYVEMQEDDDSKKELYKEIEKELNDLKDYFFQSTNVDKEREKVFYDHYNIIINEAVERFNTTFKRYFECGLKSMIFEKRGEERKKRKELVIVNIGPDEDEYVPGTIDENKALEDKETIEGKIFSEIQEEDSRLLALNTFLEMAVNMLNIKKSVGKKSFLYLRAFFTRDNVSILKNAMEKKYGISADEALEIMTTRECVLYPSLDEDLLYYTYALPPEDLKGVSENPLKKNKDIIGGGCNDPDSEINVPFVIKHVFINYFKTKHGSTITEALLSKYKRKYRDMLGDYYSIFLNEHEKI